MMLTYKAKKYATMAFQRIVTSLFAVAFSLSCSTGYAQIMKLSSKNPGNLWITGQPEQFFSPVPSGVVSAQATVDDYWGRKIYDKSVGIEKGQVAVSLPSFDPGWYTLTLTANGLSTSCTFGIVLQSEKPIGPYGGRVCADAAAAWELKPAQYDQFADIVKAIGLPMVRERIWWGDVEPQRGNFKWGRYEKLINAYSTRGIAVDEVWHDTPEWAKIRPGNGTGVPPKSEDLRNFCRKIAQHYRGKVTAWEVWNEPDNNGTFFSGSPQEFSNVMAIAYKSLKAGGGDKVTVLQGAMCLKDVSPFAEDAFSLGVGKHTDAFNWHSYEAPDRYDAILSSYREACNLGKMHTWMTEAGIFLGTNANGELSTEDARRQCEYVPKSIAQSLACGNSKHFFFLLPYRNENGACLGALRKDLTPNPSVVALSTAAHFLGNCKYLKTIESEATTEDKRSVRTTIVLFGNSKGEQVAVAWADEECNGTLQGNSIEPNKDVKVCNIFGAPISVVSNLDEIHFKLRPTPIYILLPKPKPPFPFDETFSSSEDTASRWTYTNNGGSMSIGGGNLNLSGNGSGYPVLETVENPFPKNEDWTLSVRYKYTSVGNYGTGIDLFQSDDKPVVSIHQDVNGQYVSLNSRKVWHSAPNLTWHTVSFVFSQKRLHVFVDGGKEIGSDQLNDVPTQIHIGGGMMSSPWDWNNLSLDFIRVHPGTQPSSSAK